MHTPSGSNCPLCATTDAKITDDVDMVPGKWLIECPTCGHYYVVGEARIALKSRSDAYLFSGLARGKYERESTRQLRAGERRDLLEIVSGLNPADLDGLVAQAPNEFDLATKVRKLPAAVARKSRQPGAKIKIDAAKDYPLAYARDEGELTYLVDYAVELGWLIKEARTTRESAISHYLTPKGWEEVQRPGSIDSTTAFVAMWFDYSLTPAYTDGIRPAIEDDCGYRAMRVDLEETNNDDVVDEILAQITGSQFVIADATGHRQAVYFEAGFAKGLGIPVIWTCNKSDFTEKRTFDTEHYNHILWTDPTELRKKLANRIKNSIDVGIARQAKSAM